MRQANEAASIPAGHIMVASCDDVTIIRAGGTEAVARVHDGTVSAELLSAIGSTYRAYLALENMRGSFDAAVLRVYLHLAHSLADELPDEAALGSFALYGLRIASTPSKEGAGDGLTNYLEMTPRAAQILAEALPAAMALRVSIRPYIELPEGVEISIERIRVYVATE